MLVTSVVLPGLLAGLLIRDNLYIPRSLIFMLLGMLIRLIVGAGASGAVLSFAIGVGLYSLLFGVGYELATLGHRPLGVHGVSLAGAGAVAMGLLGWGLLALFGLRPLDAALIALAAVPTSAGIAAGVLRTMAKEPGQLLPEVVKAAVADDIIGLGILAALPLIARSVGLNPISGLVALVAAVVLSALALVAMERRTRHAPLLAVALTVAAMVTGVSPGLAGVFSGYLLSGAKQLLASRVARGSLRALPALFFTGSGYLLDLRALGTLSTLEAIGLLLAALAFSRGVIALLARGSSRHRAGVGAGMAPRGEVTIALAIGLEPLIGTGGFAILIGLVLSSTLAAVAIFAPKRL